MKVPKIIKGIKLTEKEREFVSLNELSPQLISHRMNKGWSFEQAIKTPPSEYNLTKDEAVRIVKRVKRLNKTDFRDYPVAIPKIEEIAGMKVNE